MKKILRIIALFLISETSLLSQNTASRWSVNLNLFHQDHAIKFDGGSLETIDAVKVRPGFSAGIERTWREGKRRRTRLFQDLHLGFWHNPYSENYSFAGTRLGMDFRIFKSLRLSPSLIYRAGRAKPRDVRYMYEAGKWVPSDNSTAGFLRQTVAFDAQLAWLFQVNSAHPIEIQAGINWQISWKFLPVDIESNFFLYRALRLGVRYGL